MQALFQWIAVFAKRFVPTLIGWLSAALGRRMIMSGLCCPSNEMIASLFHHWRTICSVCYVDVGKIDKAIRYQISQPQPILCPVMPRRFRNSWFLRSPTCTRLLRPEFPLNTGLMPAACHVPCGSAAPPERPEQRAGSWERTRASCRRSP